MQEKVNSVLKCTSPATQQENAFHFWPCTVRVFGKGRSKRFNFPLGPLQLGDK
uniref:Uncharacterized protein n=1 Tax=Anguilla anguilla TaxID=7936 RepID=A0A0E9TYC1_ANGAN